MRQHTRTTEEAHAVEEWWRCRSPGYCNAQGHEEIARLPARRLGERAELHLEWILCIEEWLVALTDRLSNQRACRCERLQCGGSIPTLRYQRGTIMLQGCGEEEVGKGDRRREERNAITDQRDQRDDLGIVTWIWAVFNQHNEMVLEIEATSLFDLAGEDGAG